MDKKEIVIPSSITSQLPKPCTWYIPCKNDIYTLLERLNTVITNNNTAINHNVKLMHRKYSLGIRCSQIVLHNCTQHNQKMGEGSYDVSTLLEKSLAFYDKYCPSNSKIVK